MMQEIPSKWEGSEGGRYARTEEELFKKAIALLDKCKIEDPRSGDGPSQPSTEKIFDFARG